jgi:hypothetical protein
MTCKKEVEIVFKKIGLKTMFGKCGSLHMNHSSIQKPTYFPYNSENIHPLCLPSFF